ncbi:hypothetical protein AV530_009401 [Patagioenas fasciata monilis]|uniref:Uncharacterized protein n=1 Tax=Patagioenas fasciata monilis TaxID=372326 RepID=A0A1V4JIT1_PATFA|nr:hypothetical protein AV530_009401 [Patagioenas fasciata monilis]
MNSPLQIRRVRCAHPSPDPTLRFCGEQRVFEPRDEKVKERQEVAALNSPTCPSNAEASKQMPVVSPVQPSPQGQGARWQRSRSLQTRLASRVLFVLW